MSKNRYKNPSSISAHIAYESLTTKIRKAAYEAIEKAGQTGLCQEEICEAVGWEHEHALSAAVSTMWHGKPYPCLKRIGREKRGRSKSKVNIYVALRPPYDGLHHDKAKTYTQKQVDKMIQEAKAQYLYTEADMLKSFQAGFEHCKAVTYTSTLVVTPVNDTVHAGERIDHPSERHVHYQGVSMFTGVDGKQCKEAVPLSSTTKQFQEAVAKLGRFAPGEASNDN